MEAKKSDGSKKIGWMQKMDLFFPCSCERSFTVFFRLPTEMPSCGDFHGQAGRLLFTARERGIPFKVFFKMHGDFYADLLTYTGVL
jgi:hypothetical protein